VVLEVSVVLVVVVLEVTAVLVTVLLVVPEVLDFVVLVVLEYGAGGTGSARDCAAGLLGGAGSLCWMSRWCWDVVLEVPAVLETVLLDVTVALVTVVVDGSVVPKPVLVEAVVALNALVRDASGARPSC
jgi:hypothetical protein